MDSEIETQPEVKTQTQKAATYKEMLFKIQKMNPGQKQQLALKGSIIERKILMRDSNPEVQIAVLSSSKCTEAEVERVASLPSISERVLKKIYANPRWQKSLRIKLACLKNPKLPLPICRKFLSSLGKHHIKKMTKDMSVPKKIRDIAQRLIGKG